MTTETRLQLQEALEKALTEMAVQKLLIGYLLTYQSILAQALKFYADKKNYRPDIGELSTASEDGGRRARAALLSYDGE